MATDKYQSVRHLTERQRIYNVLWDRYDALDPTGARARQDVDGRCGWLYANLVPYNPVVKTGNWVDEQADVEFIARRRQSQGDPRFATEYGSRYGGCCAPAQRPGTAERVPRAYPKHQPELDPPRMQALYKKPESEARATYKDPRWLAAQEPQAREDYCHHCREACTMQKLLE